MNLTKITLSVFLLSTAVQLKSENEAPDLDLSNNSKNIMYEQASEGTLQSLKHYVHDYIVHPTTEKFATLHNYLHAYYPAIALIALQMIAVKYASKNVQAAAAPEADNGHRQPGNRAPAAQRNALRAIIDILKQSAVPTTVIATDAYLLYSAHNTIRITKANTALAHQGLPTIDAIIEFDELERKEKELTEKTEQIRKQISNMHSFNVQK